MSDYSDPFESPYLKRLRVWKDRALEAERLRTQAELQWKIIDAMNEAESRGRATTGQGKAT